MRCGAASEGKTIWKVFVRFYLSITAVLAVASAFLVPRRLGQAQDRTLKSKESLDRFLQNYLGPEAAGGDNTTRYFSAFVDLKDDGTHEVIVYVTDPH